PDLVALEVDDPRIRRPCEGSLRHSTSEGRPDQPRRWTRESGSDEQGRSGSCGQRPEVITDRVREGRWYRDKATGGASLAPRHRPGDVECVERVSARSLLELAKLRSSERYGEAAPQYLPQGLERGSFY